ncbi:hypothetical protein [Solidesulfovibrio fructosivorans]|uniref:hypothetical protein n=1 Tax=Solidesulfovibrio fructosivorans TaxID=878 RepID=UPI00117F17B6|nr:hypothetical protein [Solidesulfovibrio fructosivorans]
MSLRDKLVPGKFRRHHAGRPFGATFGEKYLFLKMRRFAAGVVVAAIASGVEAQSASCRRADCGNKNPTIATLQGCVPAERKGRSGGHKPSGGVWGRAPASSFFP